MKFVIVLACLLAIAYANEDANVLKHDVEVNVDNYHYILELDNSIKASQQGELKDKETLVVHGEYSHDLKDGKSIKVTYVADEYGYHPKVDFIK